MGRKGCGQGRTVGDSSTEVGSQTSQGMKIWESLTQGESEEQWLPGAGGPRGAIPFIEEQG